MSTSETHVSNAIIQLITTTCILICCLFNVWLSLVPHDFPEPVFFIYIIVLLYIAQYTLGWFAVLQNRIVNVLVLMVPGFGVISYAFIRTIASVIILMLYMMSSQILYVLILLIKRRNTQYIFPIPKNK